MFQSDIQKIKKQSGEIEKEAREKMVTLILAAFGLVAGLAWNEAIKGLIDYFFPLTSNGLWAKFFYAGLVTLILVLVSVYLTRLIKKDKQDEDQKP